LYYQIIAVKKWDIFWHTGYNVDTYTYFDLLYLNSGWLMLYLCSDACFCFVAWFA